MLEYSKNQAIITRFPNICLYSGPCVWSVRSWSVDFNRPISLKTRIRTGLPHVLTLVFTQVRAFVERSAALCQPEHVHVCDGSDAEASALLRLMQEQGSVKRLPKYDNWWAKKFFLIHLLHLESSRDPRDRGVPSSTGLKKISERLVERTRDPRAGE